MNKCQSKCVVNIKVVGLVFKHYPKLAVFSLNSPRNIQKKTLKTTENTLVSNTGDPGKITSSLHQNMNFTYRKRGTTLTVMSGHTYITILIISNQCSIVKMEYWRKTG